jgi:serine/threonine protein kinase
MLSQSVTDSGGRGTAKYFSPEVAAYEESGRASDIFSLGCILLEMVVAWNGFSLQTLKKLRPQEDGSFHANLSSIVEWFNVAGFAAADRFLLCEIRMMLRDRPEGRPTIKHVSERVQLFNHFLEPQQSFYSDCCISKAVACEPERMLNESVLRVTWGNTHKFLSENNRHKHQWTFFIWPSAPDLVEKIYCFLVSSYFHLLLVLSDSTGTSTGITDQE